MASLFAWNISAATLDELGSVVLATQDLDGGPHSLTVRTSEIGGRMALYGLDTPADALDALLREHGCRVSPDITLPAEPRTKDDFGGLNPDVAIVYADGVQAQAAALLDELAEQIALAAADRWNEPKYVAIRDGDGAPTPPPPSLPSALPAPPPVVKPADLVAAAAAAAVGAVIPYLAPGASVEATAAAKQAAETAAASALQLPPESR